MSLSSSSNLTSDLGMQTNDTNHKDSKEASTQFAQSTDILKNSTENENRDEATIKSASTATLKNSGENPLLSNPNTQITKNLSCSDYLLNEDINRELLCKRRTRAMYAPVQQKYYGPKATLKKVTDDYLLLIQDPLSLQLSWTKSPLNVLVIKKMCNSLCESFIKILEYLVYNLNLVAFIEESEYENKLINSDSKIKQALNPDFRHGRPGIRKFCKKLTTEDINIIDFIICLGGDGTLLHVSNVFQHSCPPVLSIHMGSLGFLCPFDFDNYKEYINGVVKGGVPLLLRNRLRCSIEKSPDVSDRLDESNPISSGTHLFNSSRLNDSSYVNDNMFEDNSLEWLSLNEIVVSRGPSPFLSNLDLYVNDYLITTVQGDGLIISTPTGSTAYAMAAGASMSHPSVPAIIIAPICPHSLSFRPIVVPAGVELKIALSVDARHTAWYSIDGRNTNELKHGYYLSITTSEYPLPSICRSDQINDWFEGLAMCLHWNQRQKQLPLNACYTQALSQSQLRSSFSSKSSSTSSLVHSVSKNSINENDQNSNANHINSTYNQSNANNNKTKFDLE